VPHDPIAADACYVRHPVFEIRPGCVIRGGSCLAPAAAATVYIGLDEKMRFRNEHGVLEVLYPVPDRGVPDDIRTFRRLLHFTEACLNGDVAVHVGCVGGHGRTGLFLAALHAYMTARTDSIDEVRRQYCGMAVESDKQIEWLRQHFSQGLPSVDRREHSA